MLAIIQLSQCHSDFFFSFFFLFVCLSFLAFEDNRAKKNPAHLEIDKIITLLDSSGLKPNATPSHSLIRETKPARVQQNEHTAFLLRPNRYRTQLVKWDSAQPCGTFEVRTNPVQLGTQWAEFIGKVKYLWPP